MAGFPPSMPPPGGAPQGPPSPAQATPGANPLSDLAGKGGSGNSGSLLQMILTFLAGSGLNSTIDSIHKLMGKSGRGDKGGQSAMQSHHAGQGGPPAMPPG